MKIFSLGNNKKGQSVIDYLLVCALIVAGVIVGVAYIRGYVSKAASVALGTSGSGTWNNWAER